jgi:hypothetical protein
MTDQNQIPRKNKNDISNIAYSVLVFFALLSIGIAILDPSSLNKVNGEPQLGAGSLIALGLSIALTIVFSIWYGKKASRE